MVVKFLCKPTKRGFTCSAEHAVRFMMLCKARALNPWEGDAFLVGYDTKDGPVFNLITAHQAFIKRAEANPAYNGMGSGVVVISPTDELLDIAGDFVPGDCQLVGGWARVHRKDQEIPTYRRLNLSTFDKGFSVWNTNKAGMIVKCAEADALRSTFPNSCGGMYTEGELAPAQAVPENAEPGKRMSLRGLKHSPSPTDGAPGSSVAPSAQNTGAATVASAGAFPAAAPSNQADAERRNMGPTPVTASDATLPAPVKQSGSGAPGPSADKADATGLPDKADAPKAMSPASAQSIPSQGGGGAPGSAAPPVGKCPQCGAAITNGECRSCGWPTAKVEKRGKRPGPAKPEAAEVPIVGNEFPAGALPAVTPEEARKTAREKAAATVAGMKQDESLAKLVDISGGGDEKARQRWIKAKGVCSFTGLANDADAAMQKRLLSYVLFYELAGE